MNLLRKFTSSIKAYGRTCGHQAPPHGSFSLLAIYAEPNSGLEELTLLPVGGLQSRPELCLSFSPAPDVLQLSAVLGGSTAG